MLDLVAPNRAAELAWSTWSAAPKMIPGPEALADGIAITDQQTEFIPLDVGAQLTLIHRLSFTLDVGRAELR
ncbi:hypothetical protein [Actinophytocola sediminis]